jgi:nucleoside phosphorylase
MIPLVRLIEQIIKEVNPGLILSVGTAGGVSEKDHLGDVMVTNKALFHLSDEFSDAWFNHYVYTSPWKPPHTLVRKAEAFMKTVKEEELWLPSPQYKSEPILPTVYDPKIKISEKPIITTDCFEYGTTENKLDALGCAVEMGDALVGMVCHDHNIPFGFIRNVSDPVINAKMHEILQAFYAVETYGKYGYTTSWNSAVAVWAMIAGGKESVKSQPPERREPAFIPEKEQRWVPLPDISWEEGEPEPEPAPFPGPPEYFEPFSAYKNFRDWEKWAPLPEADILLCVWTPHAFEALHHVMGDTEVDENGQWLKTWQPYNRNAHTIFRQLFVQKQLQRDRMDYLSPEGLTEKTLGCYRVITLGEKKVVLLYSPLSIRTDGATLPVEQVMHQVLSEVNPDLVLSAGTAAGVDETIGLGSVVVTNSARFLLGNEFNGYSLNGQVFGSTWVPPTTYKIAAEKKMEPVAWPEIVAPSVTYENIPETLEPLPDDPTIHIVDQPVITAPRRVSTGFFYAKLFEIGTTTNNLHVLGCAVDTHDAVVARQCQIHQINCSFVRALCVPVMNYKRGKTKAIQSWAQVFEEQCARMCSLNSVIAAWSLIAGNSL